MQVQPASGAHASDATTEEIDVGAVAAATSSPSPTAAAVGAATGAAAAGDIPAFRSTPAILPTLAPFPAAGAVYPSSNNSNSNAAAAAAAAVAIAAVKTLYPLTSNRGVVTPEIQAAQRNFVCPEGFRMFRVPQAESRSLMYDFGVRVEEDYGGGQIASPQQPQPQSTTPAAAPGSYGKRLRVAGRFYCMVDARCRERQTFVRISNKCTTSASDHLRVCHGITSERSVSRAQLLRGRRAVSGTTRIIPPASPKPIIKREFKRSAKAENLRASERYLADRDRFLALDYVKSHTILGLEPLDYLEDGYRRTHVLLVAGKKQLFPVDTLDSQGVKKVLVEIYDARKTAIRQALEQGRRTSPIRFAHVSIDRWAAGTSSRDNDYVGIRVHHLTQDFRLKSYLLAVRHFNPGEGVSSQRAAELTTVWAGQVLEEYGLDWSVVLGVTADPAFGVAVEIAGVLRDCCIPTVLERAMAEAFGFGETAANAKNQAVRDVLAAVKSVIERVDEAEAAENGLYYLRNDERQPVSEDGRLRQEVADRWKGGVSTLEKFLAYFPSLEVFFVARKGVPMGFDYKIQLEEIFSLIKSLMAIVPVCHSPHEPSAPPAMLRLIMVLSVDLDTSKPLELHDTEQYLPQPAAEPGGEEGTEFASPLPAPAATKNPPSKTKPPGELTKVGRSTREAAREAVYSQIGLRRWGKDYGQESHLFDMVLALHPGCRQLGYMDKLSPESPAVVSEIKGKVYAQLAHLVEAVIESERAAASTAFPETSGVDPGNAHGSTPRKRPKLVASSPFDDEPEGGEGEGEEEEDPMASAGVFDAVTGGRVEEEQGMSAADEAAEAIKAWCAAKMPAQFRTIRTGEGLTEFWRTYGVKHFRLLSVVARSILAAPGSAAVLEGNGDGSFGLANNRQREDASPVDQGYREMAMLLCAAFGSIPEDIPRLPDEAIEGAIPLRFRDPQMRDELCGLGYDAGEADRRYGINLFGVGAGADAGAEVGDGLDNGFREGREEIEGGEREWVRRT